MLGQAKLALVPPNPFTSKLARDCEKPIAHLATQMALLCPKIFLKTLVCAWFPSGEML
jgi:hypothetical protein